MAPGAVDTINLKLGHSEDITTPYDGPEIKTCGGEDMKAWFRVRATVLASMGGLTAGAILCRLLRLAPEYGLLYFWTALTGALSGGAANGVDGKRSWICFCLGTVGAMVPELALLPGYLTKLGGMGIFLLSLRKT